MKFQIINTTITKKQVRNVIEKHFLFAFCVFIHFKIKIANHLKSTH